MILTPAVILKEDPRRADSGHTGPVITVLVADDQQLLRAGFRVILESEPDITVVAEAPAVAARRLSTVATQATPTSY